MHENERGFVNVDILEQFSEIAIKKMSYKATN